MLQQKNVSQLVKEYITSELSIYECLRKGIINYSQLAEHISREYNLDSMAAIKMAIKRFADTESKLEDNEDTSIIWNIFSKAKVTIKGDVSIIVLYPSLDALKLVNELEELVNISVGETLYIIREQTAIVVIIEKDKREEALKIFRNLKKLTIKENATA